MNTSSRSTYMIYAGTALVVLAGIATVATTWAILLHTILVRIPS